MIVNEKLEDLPEIMFDKIKLSDKIKISSHPCTVEKHDKQRAKSGWNCEHVRGADKCLSGLTYFF